VLLLGAGNSRGDDCPGDCNGDGRVAVNELVLAVGVALEKSPLQSCAAVDGDADGTVRISELVTAVRRALEGCSTVSTPTPSAPPRTPTRAATEPPLDVWKLVGSWNLRRLDLPNERYNFFLLADGSVMRPFSGGRAWVKVGTWSVAGNTVRVERCAAPNFESFGLVATWTPDAAADDFGVRSCPASVQAPCPAMRGIFTYYFTDGTALAPWEVDSTAGYVSGEQWDEIYGEGWMSCHGACGEYWSTPSVLPQCGPL
jgi:hypothetical protein